MKPDSKAILTAIFVGIIGAESFLVQPGLVGGLVDHRGLTPGEAGFVASADMFGMAVASFVISLIITRISWRTLLWPSAMAIMLGNALCFYLTDPTALFAVRLIAGAGYGGFVSLSFATMGRSATPEKTFGVYITLCLVYGALGLYLMPAMLAWNGIEAVLWFFILFPLVALPFLRFFPHGGEAEGASAAHKGYRVGAMIWGAALAAIFAYFLAQGAVWAYLDRIGVAGGLRVADVGSALALCSIAGIFGATAATVQKGRFGRLWPLLCGISLSVGSLAFLVGRQDYLPYVLACSVFNFAWNYIHPFLLSIMADLDDTGRFMIWTAGLQTLGLAVGPMIAALFITPTNFEMVNLFAGTLFVVSLLLMLRAAYATGREARLA
ncbi:MFS transporter [Govanella unica]|uniref:MFS transporter n=1 Tax=Govanella unica TaxID=2975056 RepID=A0A9X3TYQ8_9PROT|nr:MFS transporter [Govania unica]MDA5194436.1 MFS transporter [Govania unica]